MKKILILGGTQFIGRNLVEQLLGISQYDITLFNRQKTSVDLFPGVNKIKGDRETSDINQISNEHWNYVIDLSCYYPDDLRSVLKCLKGDPDMYVFVSTCSVYENTSNLIQLRDEKARVLPCDDNQLTDRTVDSYGNRKAECERILQDSGLPHKILRPALVYGAFDHTDRFYYWLYQVKKRETLLLPDNGERTFSITFVNDLVETIIKSLTSKTLHTVYNVITVPQASIRQIVTYSKALLNSNVLTVNAKPAFLKENGVNEWTDMPLWIDSDYFTFSNRRWREDFNIHLFDFQESVKKTIEYYNSVGWHEPIYGMSKQKLQELLESIQL